MLLKQKLSCIGISLKMNIRGGSGVTIYYRILYPESNRKSVKPDTEINIMKLWIYEKSYMWTAEWRIIWRKIITVIYATFEVAKRKPEKNSGLYAAQVSQRSRVRIPYKPEFFSGFHFATAKVAYITAMIFLHIRNSYSYVKFDKILSTLGAS